MRGWGANLSPASISKRISNHTIAEWYLVNFYPAIDLKDGACVRLLRGAMEQATIFNDDPADIKSATS